MMMDSLLDFLGAKLADGPCRVGQVVVSGDFCIRHEEDADRDDLVRHSDPHEAIVIARYDDAGKYRPLKTAPNLAHGWLLDLGGLSEVTLALNFLYPAALGTAAVQESGRLAAVDLRQTLARQTGMYAVVKKITDAQADEVIGRVCRGRPGCLRGIVWNISPERQLACGLTPVKNRDFAQSEIPLWCAEACNLLVAEGRTVVKKPS